MFKQLTDESNFSLTEKLVGKLCFALWQIEKSFGFEIAN